MKQDLCYLKSFPLSVYLNIRVYIPIVCWSIYFVNKKVFVFHVDSKGIRNNVSIKIKAKKFIQIIFQTSHFYKSQRVSITIYMGLRLRGKTVTLLSIFFTIYWLLLPVHPLFDLLYNWNMKEPQDVHRLAKVLLVARDVSLENHFQISLSLYPIGPQG